jgi:DNA-binding NarL/FixJ family response regulator
MNPSTTSAHSAHSIGGEIVSLLHRLGFSLVVRDPDSADVLAASPGAERALLAAAPGAVRVASARVAGVALRVEVLPAEAADATVALTPRQLAVGHLLKDGLRNQEIADRLGISVHTVRRHMEQIFRRLNVTDRTTAAELLGKLPLDG